MDRASPQFTPRDGNLATGLADVAQEWGYGWEILSVEGKPGADDLCLTEGMVASADIDRGLRACISSLRSTRDNERSANLVRSLTIVLTLDGTPLDYTFGSRGELILEAGQAAAFAVAQESRLTARYRRGDQTRCLALQVSPQTLGDQELAAEIDDLLTEDSLSVAAVSSRARVLAHGLFDTRYTGLISRLLTESCALELLATALCSARHGERETIHRIKSSDVARMLRIRDLLLADLGADYSLTGLAREAGVSVSALKSKFRAVVGQSVFAFLRDQRLDRAYRGILHEEWTVARAADFVGYAHPTNFATAFRRKFGVSPLDVVRRRT